MNRHFLKSVLFHSLIFGGFAFYFAHDGALVRGGAGLAGPTHTRFDVTVASEISALPREKRLTPVREGLEIKKEKPLTLPEDVKNPKPREIEENPNAVKPAERSNGDSANLPAGNQGQGGTGSVASDQVGNSDRSNRLGLYLQRLEQRIQAQLGPSPALDFDRRARLQLLIRRDGSGMVTLLKTSGDRELDRRAIQAAERAKPYEAWESDLTIEVPVLFRAR